MDPQIQDLVTLKNRLPHSSLSFLPSLRITVSQTRTPRYAARERERQKSKESRFLWLKFLICFHFYLPLKPWFRPINSNPLIFTGERFTTLDFSCSCFLHLQISLFGIWFLVHGCGIPI